MCIKKSNLKIKTTLNKIAQWVIDKKGNRSSLALTQAGPVGIGTLTPETELEVNGKVKAGAFIGDGSQLTGLEKFKLPAGIVVMWHGTVDKLPEGWALCDGTRGTPDLRDRFICGGAAGSGETGGTNSFTLSVDNLPPHTHSCSDAGTHLHTGSSQNAGNHNHGGSTAAAGNHNHSQGNTHGVGDHTHGYVIARNESSCEAGGPVPGWVMQNGNTGGGGHHSHGNPNTNNGGNHSHGLSLSAAGEHAHSITLEENGSHTHTPGTTGEGTALDNRPAYYKIAFIMKL